MPPVFEGTPHVNVRILHISDPHGQGETIAGLEHLVESVCPDVIACTGDCDSGSLRELPASWNRWRSTSPHVVKLAVPGNHCSPTTYRNLQSWLTTTPWTLSVFGLLFVGLDTARDCLEAPSALTAASATGAITRASSSFLTGGHSPQRCQR